MTTLQDPRASSPIVPTAFTKTADGEIQPCSIGDVVQTATGRAGVIAEIGSVNAASVVAGRPMVPLVGEVNRTPAPDTDGENQAAAPPAWLPQEREPSELLTELLNRAELYQRQHELREKQRIIDRADHLKQKGAFRRRQIIRSVILKIGVDVNNERIGQAALADFDSELMDDELLGNHEADKAVPFRIRRPGWADIEAMVHFDDAGEAAAGHVDAQWFVWPREPKVYRNDGKRVRMERADHALIAADFPHACLLARDNGKRATAMAVELHQVGKDVIW